MRIHTQNARIGRLTVRRARNKLVYIGIGAGAALALLAPFSISVRIAERPIANLALAHYCPPGQSIEYAEAVSLLAANNLLSLHTSVDSGANTVTMTLSNTTGCQIPVSLASYKLSSTTSAKALFDATATAIIVPPGARSLTVRLPACAAEYDLWFGDAVPSYSGDSHISGKFLAGGHADMGATCAESGTLTAMVVSPSPASADASSGGGSGGARLAAAAAAAPVWMGGAGGMLAGTGAAPLPGAPATGGGDLPSFPNAGIGPHWQGGMIATLLSWLGL